VIGLTTVLLVEDDAQTRQLYRQVLMTAGFRVIAVGDGMDALAFLEQHDPPDAIVLDLTLPRLSGTELHQELRAHSRTSRIPVVVVTGTDVRRQEQADFQYFLHKPVVPDALIFAVDNAVRRSRLRASPH
jgi:DNA-binding response OmpR family regulator